GRALRAAARRPGRLRRRPGLRGGAPHLHRQPRGGPESREHAALGARFVPQVTARRLPGVRLSRSQWTAAFTAVKPKPTLSESAVPLPGAKVPPGKSCTSGSKTDCTRLLVE